MREAALLVAELEGDTEELVADPACVEVRVTPYKMISLDRQMLQV